MSTPEIEDYERRVAEHEEAGVSLAASATTLAAAFVGYVWWMRRNVEKEMQTVSTLQLGTALKIAMGNYREVWVALVRPHLLAGFAEGLKEVREGTVPEATLLKLADDYAAKLGDHIHEVSSEAVLRGFQRQVNRKVPPQRALQNVLSAFGVSPSTMNSLVNVWTAKEEGTVLSDVIRPNNKALTARRLIQSGIANRGKSIAENEVWVAKEMAKQVVWMDSVEKGLLPETVQRVWVTADDERVCPSCGPMHEKKVGITERFRVPDYGRMWAPPVHPSCRCIVELEYDYTKGARELVVEQMRREELVKSLVSKARGDDKYDRNPSGQFASVDTRGAKAPQAQAAPKLKPRRIEPDEPQTQLAMAQQISDMLDEAEKQHGPTPEIQAEREELANLIQELRVSDSWVGEQGTKIGEPVATQVGQTTQIGEVTRIGERTQIGETQVSDTKLSERKVSDAKIGDAKVGQTKVGEKKFELDTVKVGQVGAKTISDAQAIANLIDAKMTTQVTADGTTEKVLETDHGKYIKLDSPIAFFNEDSSLWSYDKELGTYTTVTTDFEEWEDISEVDYHFWGTEARHNYGDAATTPSFGTHPLDRLTNYWNHVRESLYQDYHEAFSYESAPVYDQNGVTLEVPEDAWIAAVNHAIQPTSSAGGYVTLMGIDSATGNQVPQEVSLSDLAYHFNLTDAVEESIPQIVIATHGMRNQVDIGPNAISRNPGAWKQVHSVEYDYQHDGIMPHQVIYVEPRDLDD